MHLLKTTQTALACPDARPSRGGPPGQTDSLPLLWTSESGDLRHRLKAIYTSTVNQGPAVNFSVSVNEPSSGMSKFRRPPSAVLGVLLFIVYLMAKPVASTNVIEGPAGKAPYALPLQFLTTKPLPVPSHLSTAAPSQKPPLIQLLNTVWRAQNIVRIAAFSTQSKTTCVGHHFCRGVAFSASS